VNSFAIIHSVSFYNFHRTGSYVCFCMFSTSKTILNTLRKNYRAKTGFCQTWNTTKFKFNYTFIPTKRSL